MKKLRFTFKVACFILAISSITHLSAMKRRVNENVKKNTVLRAKEFLKNIFLKECCKYIGLEKFLKNDKTGVENIEGWFSIIEKMVCGDSKYGIEAKESLFNLIQKCKAINLYLNKLLFHEGDFVVENKPFTEVDNKENDIFNIINKFLKKVKKERKKPELYKIFNGLKIYKKVLKIKGKEQIVYWCDINKNVTVIQIAAVSAKDNFCNCEFFGLSEQYKLCFIFSDSEVGSSCKIPEYVGFDEAMSEIDN